MNKPSKNKSDDSKEKVRPSSSKSSSSSNKNDPAGLFNFRKVKTAVVKSTDVNFQLVVILMSDLQLTIIHLEY